MPSFIITSTDSGRSVLDVLRRHLHVPTRRARQLLESGSVCLDGKPCSRGDWRVRKGQRLAIRHRPAPAAKTSGPHPVVRYVDEHIVVVDKPAGLTTMRHPDEAAEFGARARRYLPPTLAEILPQILATQTRGPASRRGRPRRAGGGGTIRAVHRLDRDTSGLVVFARTPAAESQLGRQFRAHQVERTYLALVRGRAHSGRIESHLVRDRGDGRRGSTQQDGVGKLAITHVRLVENLGNHSLVECRLETGRTHQVRIHLGEAGTPLCGERMYDRPMHGQPVPDASAAPRPLLHAVTLAFEHPATGKRVRWQSPLPEDFQRLLQRLRQAARPRDKKRGRQ